jgi:uncharacterized protein
MNNKQITATDFYRFLQCPHWPYWERFGDLKDRRDWTSAEEERLSDGLEHEKQIVSSMFRTVTEVRAELKEDAVQETLELMQAGEPFIYQGSLEAGDWFGKPDILERQPGKSRFGDYYYVPVDIKNAQHLKKHHKAQLVFYCLLLEKIQGHFPGYPAVINADAERLSFGAEEFLPDFQNMLEKIEESVSGVCPEPVFRKACIDTSPWGAACFRLAEEREDIALIYNVDVRRLSALRYFGIRTIHDAAAMDIDRLEGQAPGLTRRALESAKRQATALIREAVIIREPFTDPTKGLEIHFDIESHPPTDRDYLYGFLIRRSGVDEYISFVAESPEEEEKMWRGFLAWTEELPETFTVYHYAQYEFQRLHQLAKRYDCADHEGLVRFMNAFIDLKEVARTHVTFPLHFYSLKSIAKFLGFEWKGDVKGGGESIFAFDRWLETRDRSHLDAIIDYNEEDVRATAHLIDWMRAHAGEETTYEKPYPWK